MFKSTSTLIVAALFGFVVQGTIPPTGGVGAGWTPPSGMLILASSGTSCPSGTSEATDLDGFGLIATTIANGNVGSTGGSDTITPAGTNSAPTFTGNSVASSAVSAGTPAGTVAAPTFTGSSASTSSDSAGTPAGTNSTGTVTPSGTIAWPAGVPTAANESAHTHSESLTAAAQTFTGTPSSCVANHVHVETINSSISGATGNGFPALLDASTSGGPTSLWMSTANNTGGSATCTYAGTNGTSAVTGTSGAGSAHTHTISWPAGVPTLTGSSSTTSAQTFTGSALGNHSHTVTATGTNSAPAFTGSALGTHSHTTTATGSVSAPTFTGTQGDNRSAFLRVIVCRVN